MWWGKPVLKSKNAVARKYDGRMRYGSEHENWCCMCIELSTHLRRNILAMHVKVQGGHGRVQVQMLLGFASAAGSVVLPCAAVDVAPPEPYQVAPLMNEENYFPTPPRSSAC